MSERKAVHGKVREGPESHSGGDSLIFHLTKFGPVLVDMRRGDKNRFLSSLQGAIAFGSNQGTARTFSLLQFLSFMSGNEENEVMGTVLF